MSRVGKKPIDIPNGVKVDIKENLLVVEGPKGKLEQEYQPEVSFKLEENQLVVERKDDSKRARAMHGLYRSLANNMVIGVTELFKKTLIINGVGYRAEVKGKNLVLNLGYSNPIEYVIPEDVTIACDGNTKVIVSGLKKQAVGLVSSEIRSLRLPEPYKGKGIKYEDEHIRRKVGKSGIK